MIAHSLVTIPHEVLQSILQEVEAVDLASLSICCSSLSSFIKDNRLLFKHLYLRFYDDPRGITNDQEPHWQTELMNAVKLRKILESKNVNVKRNNFTFVAQTIIRLLDTTQHEPHPSLNLPFLIAMLKIRVNEKRINVDTLLCCSSLFECAGSEDNQAAPTVEERQLSAQLHSLYGVPVRAKEDESVATQPYACSKVYDLRRYTPRTLWGPFLDDGSMRVDWEKVETVMIDIGHNLSLFRERSDNQFPEIWGDPFSAATPRSYRPRLSLSISPSAGSVPTSEFEDPYNVTGTWMRVVCFLDYSELYAFNFGRDPPPTDEDREPLDTEEAIRLITMKLRVTSVEPPGDDDGKDFPVVHFRGTSRSMHPSYDPNANSDIRGSVRLTPHGDIRWTTYSMYFGEERWKSEGIQIGGLRSARGVLGNWFDAHYDDRGPAGPTAFWKLSEDPPEEKARRVL